MSNGYQAIVDTVTQASNLGINIFHHCPIYASRNSWKSVQKRNGSLPLCLTVIKKIPPLKEERNLGVEKLDRGGEEYDISLLCGESRSRVSVFAYEITFARLARTLVRDQFSLLFPLATTSSRVNEIPRRWCPVLRIGDRVSAYNYSTNQANRCIPVQRLSPTLWWRENERGNARTSRPSLNFWRFAMLVCGAGGRVLIAGAYRRWNFISLGLTLK